jgi:hypothetical protein
MLFHDGEMDGIARRKPTMSEDNLFGPLGGRPRNVKHLIHNPEQSIECRLDGVPAVDGGGPVQDLLQDLGVGDEPLAVIDQLFEPSLCVALVRVGRAHEVHGNVRIDKNHGCAPAPYPISISASMRSMSAVG